VDYVDILTQDDLKSLAEKRGRLCISIYMPTHRAEAQIQGDPLRLKNLLNRVEGRLQQSGLSPRAMHALLKPAQQLLADGIFWQHQGDGLAIFLAGGVFYRYCLPLAFDELLVVAGRFHLKPLLPLVSGNGRFYVLALSQNSARLLEATRYTVEEVELAGIPTSLAEALQYEDPERQLQHHAGAPTGRGVSALFHGHGVGAGDMEKENILRYFHQLDKGLRKFLRDEKAPLVLAGVEYLLPLYEQANSYPNLMDEGIRGNPDSCSARELHENAWPIVQPYFDKAREAHMAEYNRLAGRSDTSADLTAILLAAHYGRIKVLFVPLDARQWGTFDPVTSTLTLHPAAEPGDEELLDLAAVQTLMYGGTVYVVGPDQMPDGTSLAAIFRY
jgi:hypothetical protein